MKKKKSKIQPNQPSDPRKEVVTEQKEPLQYLCLLEWKYLICQLCFCLAAIYTLFSLIIPANPAVQMRMKYLCLAMLDLKMSSHPSSVSDSSTGHCIPFTCTYRLMVTQKCVRFLLYWQRGWLEPFAQIQMQR